MVASVGRCGIGDQRYAVPVRQLRAFDALFGSVDGALARAFSAGGRFGDAAVGGQLVEFEADHPVIAGEDEQAQGLHRADGDPFVASTAQGGGGAGTVGHPLVSAVEDQDLHQTVEDHRVTDARVVAAPRMAVLPHRQQREEPATNRVQHA
ncbi:hypothetical protein P3T27_003229 [Kitasatospora sp. MAA19]|nr:hypothetical protein [Kitasatospora sp. MAA19]